MVTVGFVCNFEPVTDLAFVVPALFMWLPAHDNCGPYCEVVDLLHLEVDLVVDFAENDSFKEVV